MNSACSLPDNFTKNIMALLFLQSRSLNNRLEEDVYKNLFTSSSCCFCHPYHWCLSNRQVPDEPRRFSWIQSHARQEVFQLRVQAGKESATTRPFQSHPWSTAGGRRTNILRTALRGEGHSQIRPGALLAGLVETRSYHQIARAPAGWAQWCTNTGTHFRSDHEEYRLHYHLS